MGGEAAWQAGSEKWQASLQQGVNSYISSGVQTLNPLGEVFHLPITGLFQTARALPLLAEVEAIVLVVQTDEFLYTGLPLDFVDFVTYVDDHLGAFKPKGHRLHSDRVNLLNHLLGQWKPVTTSGR